MEKESLIPWLVEPEWAGSYPARALLGVLVQPKPLPQRDLWPLLWDQKLVGLAQRADLEDLNVALEQYYPPEVDLWGSFPPLRRKPRADQLLGLLLEHPSVQSLKVNVEGYLRGNPVCLEFLEEKINSLKDNNPVSQQEFRKELLDLSLLEFLEMVT